MPDDDTSEPGTVIDLDANADELSVLKASSHRKMRLEIEGDDDGSWFRVPRGWLPFLPSFTPAQYRVAVCLCSHANRQWLAWPGRARLMQVTGLEKTAVSGAMSWLRDEGFITRRRVRMRRRVFKSWLINCKPVKPAEAVDRSLFDLDADDAGGPEPGADPPCPAPAYADISASGRAEMSAPAGAPAPAYADKSAGAGAKCPPGRAHNRIREQDKDDDVVVLFDRLAAEGFDRGDAEAVVARVGADKVRGILLRADEMERKAPTAKPAFRKSRFHYLAWAFANPHFVSVAGPQAQAQREAQQREQAVKRGDAIRFVRSLPSDRLQQLWGRAVAEAADATERAAYKRAPESNCELALRMVELAAMGGAP